MRLDSRLISVAALFSLLTACGGDDDADPPKPPKTWQVGGTATGMLGSGLRLQLNGVQELTLAANGNFAFPAALVTGTTYAVTISGQPANPTQTCTLANATGTVGGGPISNVAVTCATNQYVLGGSVAGLDGDGLVLRNNGGADLAVSADGAFSFVGSLDSGTDYSVTVHSQPVNPVQTCAVTGGEGRIGAADVSTVSVVCTTSRYSVGGSTSGLLGNGLVLRLNGGTDVAVTGNGGFEFPGALASGTSYSVAIESQPENPHQTCLLTNATGNVIASDIANIGVSCTTNTYAVGGVVTGLTSSSLVLELNGSQQLAVATDGAFVFSTPLASGTAYTATVAQQSDSFREYCVVTDATGTVVGSSVTSLNVQCTAYSSFVYVPGDATGALRTYGIHPDDGALVPFPSTVSIGTSPRAMVVAPSGNALYAANYFSNTLVAVAVDADRGTLSPLATIAVSGLASGAHDLAIAPSGNFLYVVNDLGDTITRFAIDLATGQPGGPAVVANMPAPTDRTEIAITPDGAFLYAVAVDVGNSATVTAFTIDATTGALTAGPTLNPGLVEPRVTIDPTSRSLYLQRLASPFLDVIETTVLPHTIDPGTGALTAVGAGTTVRSNGQDFAVDPSGSFAYLLDNYNGPSSVNHLDAFAVDPVNGALTTIGTPTPARYTGWKLAFDPDGRFLFVGSHGPSVTSPGGAWHDVAGYGIAASGPTAGQLSVAGTGTRNVGPIQGSSNVTGVIAVLP